MGSTCKHLHTGWGSAVCTAALLHSNTVQHTQHTWGLRTSKPMIYICTHLYLLLRMLIRILNISPVAAQSTDRTYIIYWRRSFSISAIFPSIQMFFRRSFTLRYMSLLASNIRLEASLTSDPDLSCSRLLLYLNHTQHIPPTATGLRECSDTIGCAGADVTKCWSKKKEKSL